MNKAFIALLWIASALLTYWLGLEQGSDSAYTGPGKLALTNDNALIAKKNEGISQVTAKASPALPPREPSAPIEVVEVNFDRAEEKIYESDSLDLQERIKSSNPVVRLRAFTELLQDGSPQSIEQAREIYEKLPEGPQRFSELRMLAFSWGQSDPQAAQLRIESMIAQRIATLTMELAQQEQMTSQQDPIVALKQRELDLRAMDMQRKAEESMMNMEIKENQIEEQLDIEKMKLENNEDQAAERIRIAEEKIELARSKKK